MDIEGVGKKGFWVNLVLPSSVYNLLHADEGRGFIPYVRNWLPDRTAVLPTSNRLENVKISHK